MPLSRVRLRSLPGTFFPQTMTSGSVVSAYPLVGWPRPSLPLASIGRTGVAADLGFGTGSAGLKMSSVRSGHVGRERDRMEAWL